MNAIRTPQRSAVLTACVLLPLLITTTRAVAQSGYTDHTVQADSGLAAPRASIGDVAWIAGHWKGEAFGGTCEEVWSPPLGPSMMGMYKFVHADGVGFYELLTIAELENSLILRLKHFNADLTGWETKDETVDFTLVRAVPDTAYFAGMTFVRESPDQMRIFLASSHKDGSVSELEFEYHRRSEE